jgi:DNA adenine methylase
MVASPALVSPLPWIGGKHYLAHKIVNALPDPAHYDTYVDLFGGGGSVLIARPPSWQHIEVYNDINQDLVNFWMHCRDDVAHLQERLDSLPYSRALHYQYHASLYKEAAALPPLERAVRWFYVLRSSFNGRMDKERSNGWGMSVKKGTNHAHTYHSAIALFGALQQRFRDVQIDNLDFERAIGAYNRPRTLFYCDPPYIGTEGYHQYPFTMADHERLAELLNASPAMIALSYYPHPQLSDWYPAERWRRITWATVKHAQRTKETHTQATELLLCNYPAQETTLWGQDDPK